MNYDGYYSPKSGEKLTYKEGILYSKNGDQFPVINGIPRFVPQDNYAQPFGLQWKTFPKIQLDSFNGAKISESRLVRNLGIPLEKLSGKKVLEVGCGAGRFTEILVKYSGELFSVDLSEAVEVNKENIGELNNYHIAQANVYSLPFQPE